MKMEKSLYPLKVWIIYITIIGLYLICLAFCYINIMQFIDGGIFSVCLLVFLTVLFLWPVIQIIKYIPFSAKIIMDDEGIHYKSKAAEHFMPWSKVKKVQTAGSGEIEHLYFWDNSVKTILWPSFALRKISDSRMWVYFYPEMIDFIEQHWSRCIDNIDFIKKHEAKKQERRLRKHERKQI